jgi:hypothetical protein
MKLKIIYTLFILITSTLGGIWGYFQVNMFPIETYGNLWIFTAFGGGFLIGYICAQVYWFFFKDYY